MDIIDNIQTFDAYLEIKRTPELWEKSYKTGESYYPDIVKKILNKDKFIMPKHLGQQLLKELYIRQLKRLEPEFVNDQNTDSVVNLICLYLRRDPAFLTQAKGTSFTKGILLKGTVGSGKTLLMRGMANLLKAFSDIERYNQTAHELSFKLTESWQIAEDFAQRGFEAISEHLGTLNPVVDCSICIDDMGSETTTTHYGNTVNTVGELILKRYKTFKEKPGRYYTHGTTNLGVQGLKEFYGERAFSRMREMFNDIHLPGTDRRK